MVPANLAFPHYTTKFVNLTGHILGTRQSIMDARPDLCMVGYTQDRMIDVDPSAPVTILSGHPVGMTEGPSSDTHTKLYWGFKINSPEAIEAEFVGYPTSLPKGTYVVARRHGSKLVTEKRLGKRPNQAVDALYFGRKTNLPRLPSWLYPEVKKLTHSSFGNYGEIAETKPIAGLFYENITYYPVTPGQDVSHHDQERTIPCLRIGARHQLLTQCLDTPNRYELDEIVWAAPSGWLIVRARKGDDDGYLWLFPKKTG